MRKLLFGFVILLSYYGFATHNRAGEILYKRIQPFTTNVGGNIVQIYTYSFTIIVYTDDGPNVADRCEDTLYFGDGLRAVAQRINGTTGCGCGTTSCGVLVINDPGFKVKKNIYTITHTYAGPGNYKVYFNDPNRNKDVYNIPNSVNQMFYLESLLMINSFTGANSSPVFGFDPIDKACFQKCFYHNPGAYDPDGDSLSYEITYSRGENGIQVPGYTNPDPGPGGYYGINSTNGTLTWCSPQFIAQYNLAFYVKEWRKNTSGVYQMVGYVLRDMQVIVQSCLKNNPPFIKVPIDTCVEAGTLINKDLIVSDPDTNVVVISGEGGAFSGIAPVANLSNTSGTSTFTAKFVWQTTCGHIRQQPYNNVFKAEDQPQFPPKLVYFTSYNIRVVPPSVKNVTVVPFGSSMKITWQLSTCNPTNNPITAYKVFRKNDCTPVVFDPCKSGIDPSLGYTYVGQTPSTGTLLIDNNGGNGLVVGQDYSYLVIAVYTDGSQSYASTQICAKLKRDVPILLNVDILSTSVSTGSIFVRWTRPLTTTGNFDPIAFPGPYQFNLKYKAGSTGTYSTILTTTNVLLSQLDTSFTHLNVNTIDTDHQYEVEFISGATVVGSSQKATSVFLIATAGDRKVDLNWVATTPWNNDTFKIYRKDPGAASFTMIASTTLSKYTDNNNVVNRATYCYKVLSKGKYSDPQVFKPLLNNSQEVCATAKDLSIPCTPTVSITANCPVGYVKVEWNNVALSCSDDVIKYVLFKKPTINDEYVKVDTLYGSNNISYAFDNGVNLISSCFAIQSIDSSGNASALSQDYCVDNCPEFELPNIITLNGDGINDFFKAIKVRQIKEIDLYVYDRWGNLVYKTKDPYFNWDGVSIMSKRLVSEGTFFFICDVYEPRVTGIKKRNLKGYLQVVW